MNAIMFKLQAEGIDTYNNLYIKTYGEDYIDEQIKKLNNLSSANNLDDDDYDDLEDDEEYVPHMDNEDEDEDDNGSKHTYIYQQVKRMQTHISNLLGYFVRTNTSVNQQVESECY